MAPRATLDVLGRAEVRQREAAIWPPRRQRRLRSRDTGSLERWELQRASHGLHFKAPEGLWTPSRACGHPLFWLRRAGCGYRSQTAAYLDVCGLLLCGSPSSKGLAGTQDGCRDVTAANRIPALHVSPVSGFKSLFPFWVQLKTALLVHFLQKRAKDAFN